MAQASRPPSGQNTDRPSLVAPPCSAPPKLDGLNSSAARLSQHQHQPGLVDRSPQSIIEGILGPNKDGRVRNPIPSKLKGRTNNKQGNFGVMHIAGIKKHEPQGRDAAARRTSEITASRAKAAQQEKYVPPIKRGLEATLHDVTHITNRGSPFGRDDKRQARPLAPDETKMEQARLLTLLRSINPITVVDQICKAVAYFGGIPGAPPPKDGIFPESANTRETGALFIGWLAEIFPDVSATKPTEFMKPPGGKKSRPSQGQQVTASPADAAASGEEPNSRNGYGFGPAVSAPSWGLPQNLAEVNPQPLTVPDTTNEQNKQPVQPGQQQAPVTPAQALAADMTSNATSASTKRRGRGRPKGSTNKKMRGDDQQGDFAVDGMNNGHMDGQNMASDMLQAQDLGGVSNASPQDQGQLALHLAVKQSVVPVAKAPQVSQYSDQSWQTNPQKDHLGESSVTIPDELSPEERAVLVAFRNGGPDGAMSAVSAVSGAMAPIPSPVAPTKGPAEGGAKRKRAPTKPKATPTLPLNTAIPNSTAASSTGYGSQGSPQAQQQQLQKQIQHTPKVQQNQHSIPQMQHLQSQVPQRPSGNGPMSNANDDLAINMAKDAMQWGQIEAIPPAPTAPPPAKRQRQRKPKVPATASVTTIEPPSRTQTASVTSTATPILPPSTIPDSQDVASQQNSQPNIPVSRPTEGLEAHFERFATHTTHQNGRSHTPTIMPQQQKQQQHVLQQSKPSSVPPQQSTPHIPQQMQQQKSQQGTQQSLQRNDMKTAQDSASRPPSAFYNQRSKSATTYQQYPPHQASQLYVAQPASPQIGSSNSYRTNNSHTMAQSTMSQNSLAQASPQFSQPEAYRTASPHIAQPSPSFSQNESNYRTTSSHNMAQASPSFSQAENPYKTPSTHSLTQGTSAYSTSRSHVHAPSTHPGQPQNHYHQFSESPYIDLPIPLQSLGHTGGGSAASLGGYGQGLGSLGGASNAPSNSHSRATDGSASVYGATSSGLGPFESTADNLLRMPRGPVSGGSNPANTHAQSPFGRTSGGMDSAFENEHEMREQLLRGMGSQR